MVSGTAGDEQSRNHLHDGGTVHIDGHAERQYEACNFFIGIVDVLMEDIFFFRNSAGACRIAGDIEGCDKHLNRTVDGKNQGICHQSHIVCITHGRQDGEQDDGTGTRGSRRTDGSDNRQ